MYSAATDLPTPPKGRATIRLCRTLSLEQKLPLDVSLISLEMTCVARKAMIRIHIGCISTINAEGLSFNVSCTLLLLEYAYTQRGFSCLLMKVIASSILLTVRTGRTGPKMSCFMMGSSSATSVKIVGASDKKENRFTAVLHVMHDTVCFVLETSTQRMLTDIFLRFYYLPAHGHLARSPQHVSRTVEDLWIDHAAETSGLSGIRTVELHQAALQGLHQPFFDIHVAQDVVRSHQALSSVMKTCPGDALCGGGNLTVLVHIARVLATQNQGDRCECASCSLSKPAALLPAPLGLTDILNNFRLIQWIIT